MAIFIRILLLGLVVFVVFKIIRKSLTGPAQRNANNFSEKDWDSSDPYRILGLSRNSSSEEIKAAYRKNIAEYHPDKVAHLGQDLQKLAILRTRQINSAYDKLE